MVEIGLVVEADSKKVKIRIPRTSACGGNCAQCGSACGGNSGVYTAENAQGLQVGDRVRLFFDDKKNVVMAALEE